MNLIDRVRDQLSSYQVDVDPHEWRLPSPSPSAIASLKAAGESAKQKHTSIPDPRIFRSAFIPPSHSTLGTGSHGEAVGLLSYPDAGHAAVHLCLLECFRKLRLGASALDIPVHHPPEYQEKHVTGGLPEQPSAVPESKRWDLLIRLAITRFGAWWASIDQLLQHATTYTHHAGDKAAVQLTKDYLPPLDVLMVWHALMLSDPPHPDSGHGGYEDPYTNACRARNVPKLDQLAFPWTAIRDVLNTRDMVFNLTRPAETLFSTLSGQAADYMAYLNDPPAYTECAAMPFGSEATMPTDDFLFEEIKKQEKFWERSHELLWIRAPSLTGSLERSCDGYLQAVLGGAITSQDEDDDEPDTGKRVIHSDSDVETSTDIQNMSFGVQLIWRTHRLYPAHYHQFTERIASGARSTEARDIDGSPMSPVASEHSSRMLRESASGDVCACWTCERIRDELPDYARTPPGTSDSADFGVDMLRTLRTAQIRQIQDDLGFYVAAEEVRRRDATMVF
ncbi:hypothetical protein F4778DRAFT_728124 [Xylariomycetidae sp. FL2044]|nr:hypothetical protein F4778DRAFT_728124 [Xylariomycetidae sp. FL2044]